jgi:hypothetical protein
MEERKNDDRADRISYVALLPRMAGLDGGAITSDPEALLLGKTDRASCKARRREVSAPYGLRSGILLRCEAPSSSSQIA